MFSFRVFVYLIWCTGLCVKCDCNIVSKKEWDGILPTHVEYLNRPLDLVIIQHTATGGCSTDAACEEMVRSIQNNHMDNLHYWDIGPSFLVGGNGKVYEGSGWLHVGAHTFKYNRFSIGISFVGNYNEMEPSPASLEAVKALLDCGVKKGHLASNYSILGHRQLIASESPGRKLYNIIRRWPQYSEDVTKFKSKIK